jgi:hypothetical protein
MDRHWRGCLAIASALALASIVGSVARAADYKAPRTSWGAPDLQGTWTNASLTSLERNDAFKDKPFLSDAEAKEFERNNAFAQFAAEDAKPTAPDKKATKAADPGGYKVPYTPDGLKAFQAARASLSFDGPEVRALGERCLLGFGSTSGPPMLPDVYNNNYQIVQTPDAVMILVEMVHDARIIRMNGKRLPPTITPWMGDSIGRWEGDTLVVETTNLNPGQKAHYGIKQRFYLPPTGKVIERFTRVSAKEILYQFTVEDSTAYTRPWKGEVPLLATNDQIYEYACHEGNYALPGILAGAREAEKAAARPK